jgi:hypothetical protein
MGTFSSRHSSLIYQVQSWSFDPEATIDCSVPTDDPTLQTDLLIGVSRKHEKEPSIHWGERKDLFHSTVRVVYMDSEQGPGPGFESESNSSNWFGIWVFEVLGRG